MMDSLVNIASCDLDWLIYINPLFVYDSDVQKS